MTVGGMEAIFLAARILLEKGDKVLLPDPDGSDAHGGGKARALVEPYPLEEKGGW